MAEGDVRPGSWVGDTVEEFKKLPTWGKIAIGVVVLGVAGLAYYQWKQSQTASTASTASNSGLGIPGGATDTSGSGSSGGSGSTTTTPTTPTTPTTSTGGSPVTGTPVGVKPIAPPTKTTPTKKKAPKLKTYTVQRGDTLSGIAAKLGIKGGWQALYNENKGVIGNNPNLIYAGTKLSIPA